MNKITHKELSGAVKHFRTITRHKILVMQKCFRVGLYRQGLLHDLSKYSPTEFLVGMKYYQGNRSPNNAEREDTGVSLSWLHHKGRNRHHYEYWVDYDPARGERILAGARMPRKYVAEMVMDRISASQVYNDGTYNDRMPLEYYERNKDKLWFVHEKTKRDLSRILTILAEEGEDAMYDYVKYVYLGKKRKNNKEKCADESAYHRTCQ